MGLVTDILDSIDASIAATGERYFETTASALGPIATIMMTIFVIALGINIATGASDLSLRDAKQLFWRVILVYTFGLSWANFGVLYHALSDGAGNLAMGFFDASRSGSSDPNTAMDSFAKNMADTVDDVSASRGSIMRGVIGGFAYVILGLLMAAYVLVVGFAKIMIAFLLGVAPLAMIATIFDKTRNLFEAWLESFVGYLMYPIAAAAIIASVVKVGEEQALGLTEGESTLGSILGFVVVVFVGIFALKAIPTAASHITGQFRLASISPQPIRAATRPLTGAAARWTGARLGAMGSGMMSGGQSPKLARDQRDRAYAERGGKLAEKIRLSMVLGTMPKG